MVRVSATLAVAVAGVMVVAAAVVVDVVVGVVVLDAKVEVVDVVVEAGAVECEGTNSKYKYKLYIKTGGHQWVSLINN